MRFRDLTVEVALEVKHGLVQEATAGDSPFGQWLASLRGRRFETADLMAGLREASGHSIADREEYEKFLSQLLQ
jgi:hypothetical protein